VENKVIELLDEVTKLLTEKGWTQGFYARNKNGAPTDCRSDSACSFCLHGALMAADEKRPDDKRAEAGYRLHRALGDVLSGGDLVAYLDGHVDIVSFNDAPGRTKEEVLDLIERAKKLEAESGD